MEIVDDISSKAFKRAETNIHGKLKNYFLTHYAHFLVPGLNLNKKPRIDTWHIENVMGLDQEFPYNCDFPKPLLPPVKITKNVLNGGDPARQLLATKSHIENDVTRILDHYQKHKEVFSSIPLKKDIQWKEDSGKKATSLPRYVADLADMIEMDPDPYFLGMYNWYYTGGSLTTLSLGEDNLLLFPYMNDLVVTPVTLTNNSLWKPNLLTAASCNITGTIFETRVNRRNNSYRVLGREKNNCILYSLGENHGKLRLTQVQEQESRKPYVSADLDPINYNKFCTLNVDRTLTLWDTVSSKRIKSHSIDVSTVPEDKWGSIRYMNSDPHTIVYVDRCCLHYLDTRDSYERPVLTLCPRAHLESCESLCLGLPSCSEDHYYLASYHSLLMCDRRSPQANVQQKWTHQFKSPPLLGAVHKRNENEIIVLSSQIAGETTMILNTWDGRDSPHSYSLPHTPPSVLDTLRESRMQGKCLDPWLRKRLELSTAGVCMAGDSNGDLSLFLQNSIGDIFYQCVTHEDSLDKYSHVNCQSYYAMEAWEKKILEHERLITPLVMTNRTNMHRPFNNFTNESSRYEPQSDPNELWWNPEWKQSLEKLKSYVDILAPELLAVWEVSEENLPDLHTAVPRQKVLHWLEMTEEKDATESQEIPDLTSTPINTEELLSASQQLEVINLVDDLPQESIYPPVKVKIGRKPQPKKRTYIAGF